MSEFIFFLYPIFPRDVIFFLDSAYDAKKYHLNFFFSKSKWRALFQFQSEFCFVKKNNGGEIKIVRAKKKAWDERANYYSDASPQFPESLIVKFLNWWKFEKRKTGWKPSSLTDLNLPLKFKIIFKKNYIINKGEMF